MSTITFSPDGSSFTVPTDIPGIAGEHRYITEHWYSMPVPFKGWADHEVWFHDQYGNVSGNPNSAICWMLRKPIPRPLPKTQEQLDEQAFNEHANKRDLSRPGMFVAACDFWHEALKWERSRK